MDADEALIRALYEPVRPSAVANFAPVTHEQLLMLGRPALQALLDTYLLWQRSGYWPEAQRPEDNEIVRRILYLEQLLLHADRGVMPYIHRPAGYYRTASVLWAYLEGAWHRISRANAGDYGGVWLDKGHERELYRESPLVLSEDDLWLLNEPDRHRATYWVRMLGPGYDRQMIYGAIREWPQQSGR